MDIVFTSDSLKPRVVDMAYTEEAKVAKALSLPVYCINYEALIDFDVKRALQRISYSDKVRQAVYRGWMMEPSIYSSLYQGLQQRGIQLINTPEQYEHCHYLPRSYHIIQSKTPKTVWIENRSGFSINHIMEKLQIFGDKPLVLKDYVKSQKHYWKEACFIPSACEQAAVERIVKRFLELQGNKPEGGLVFREFIEFEPIGTHHRHATHNGI